MLLCLRRRLSAFTGKPIACLRGHDTCVPCHRCASPETHTYPGDLCSDCFAREYDLTDGWEREVEQEPAGDWEDGSGFCACHDNVVCYICLQN